jgi:rod shape-determining protein MreC
MNLEQAQQRIRWLAMGALVVVAILLTILDSTGNLRGALNFLRDPFTIVMSWSAAPTDRLADTLSGPRDLQTAWARIAELEAENAAMARQIEELSEAQGELQLYENLFERAAASPEYRRVTASVIGQDTSIGVRSIIIDKGVNDGVRVGAPVESARGLVGQVYQATANAAQVILLTDSSSAIPVRLGTTRATGILRGGGLGGITTIDWIDLKFQVEPGELVMTSGLDGKFPQDLVIGRVIEVERNEAALFQQAVVQPAEDVTSLEVVFVITDFQTIDLGVFTQEE